MHKFLRAVGFSNIKKKDLDIILEDIIEHPELMKVTKSSEGYEFAEMKKTFGDTIGLTICGFYDEENLFHMDYYYPYVSSTVLSTQEQVDIEKYAEKEAYAGVCDEMRLGVTLIFYLQNAADFLSEYRNNIHVKHLHGAVLSALSVEGKILLPIEQKAKAKQAADFRYEKRKELIAEAREGNEDAIESLTMEDMDIYTILSNRITNEDIYSIVNSTFMPYGIESDQYSILGEILEVEEIENTLTKEMMYYIKLECNDMVFCVTINQNDLLGEPAIGRRFKGNIWMQGVVCL